MGLRGIILLSLICTFSLIFIPSEAAQESYKGKAIGIILSKSCLALIKSGMNSTCPGYDRLMSLDNSNQKFSGKFVLKDGILQRGTPSYLKSDLTAYRYNSTFFIFVDPPKTSKNLLPLITIEASLPEFHMTDQYAITEIKESNLIDAKATKTQRLYFKDRWVDRGCVNASISSKGGMELLVDTINYMKQDCNPNYTNIKTLFAEIRNVTTHDISGTYKWKLDKQYQYIKDNCLSKEGSCKTISQATWGDLGDTLKPSKNHMVISLNG